MGAPEVLRRMGEDSGSYGDTGGQSRERFRKRIPLGDLEVRRRQWPKFQLEKGRQ